MASCRFGHAATCVPPELGGPRACTVITSAEMDARTPPERVSDMELHRINTHQIMRLAARLQLVGGGARVF